MEKKSILSLDFFESIHEKDAYYEKITDPKIVDRITMTKSEKLTAIALIRLWE